MAGAEAKKKPAAKPRIHAHGCARCDVRYEDACGTPAVDGLCMSCRGGIPWQLLITHRSPQDCCRIESRRVTKDERERYRLAGPKTRTWWICPACGRTQVYDAKTTRGSES
jgi:predicted RNA-binding Zn-ribbon protein involved in translation (DUF1610 family)